VRGDQAAIVRWRRRTGLAGFIVRCWPRSSASEQRRRSSFGAGTTFAPEVLPLNLDAWTFIAIGAPLLPFFPGFSGLLDVDGNANASVDLTSITIPPVFIGQRFTCAVMGLDGGGYWVGGPSQFEIWP